MKQLVAAVLVSWVSMRTAQARCDQPWCGLDGERIEVSPRSGATLPPDPTLFIQVDGALPPIAVLDDGRAVAYEIERIGSTNYGEVFAFHVRAGAGHLEVRPLDGIYEPAHFDIDPSRSGAVHGVAYGRRRSGDLDAIQIDGANIEAVRFTCTGASTSFAAYEPSAKVDLPYSYHFPTRLLYWDPFPLRSAEPRWAADLALKHGADDVRCRIETFASDGTTSDVTRDLTSLPWVTQSSPAAAGTPASVTRPRAPLSTSRGARAPIVIACAAIALLLVARRRRARRALVIVIALAAAAIATREAAAECARPRTLISPPSGSWLPPNPTIYVFARDDDASLAVTRDGAPLDTQRTVVGRTAAWTVTRVTIHTDARGPIDVGDAHYTIGQIPFDDAWLLAGEPVDDEWTCSFTRGLRLYVRGTAIAYRLDAARDVTALRNGTFETAFLYPHPNDQRGALSANDLVIGDLSCRGSDLADAAAELLRGGAYVRLVALYADGRERGAELGYARISDHAVVVPDWYDGFLDLSIDQAPPCLARSMRKDVSDLPWAALAAATGGGALATLASILLFARTRRRTRGVVGRL